MMQTDVGRSSQPSDTFAFEARSFFGRMHDRVRGAELEDELPRAGNEDAEPRPLVVEAAATAAKTIGFVVTLIVASAVAIVGVLVGFAGAMSLITG